MMKRLAALLIVVVLCCGCFVVGEAHNKDKHWSDLKQVLFGSYYYFQTDKQQIAFDKLKFASALAIDQFNGYYDSMLKQLNNWGVHGIPTDLDAINFTCNSHH